jgi:hypothetical protein
VIIKDEFIVKYPIEAFVEWMHNRGVEDGILDEHWEIDLSDVELEDNYVRVSGDIIRKVDA